MRFLLRPPSLSISKFLPFHQSDSDTSRLTYLNQTQQLLSNFQGRSTSTPYSVYKQKPGINSNSSQSTLAMCQQDILEVVCDTEHEHVVYQEMGPVVPCQIAQQRRDWCDRIQSLVVDAGAVPADECGECIRNQRFEEALGGLSQGYGYPRAWSPASSS